jgi:hypothetical protein
VHNIEEIMLEAILKGGMIKQAKNQTFELGLV